MPAVTDWSSPNGEPIAITHWPGLRSAELPGRIQRRPSASIFSTATSYCSSLPTTSASSSRRSDRVTVTVSAPAITWWLVSTYPSSEITNPLPSETPPPRGPSGTPGNGMPKRRSKSSSPGGSCCDRSACRGAVSALMFTTAGPTRSTSAVKSGSPVTSGAAVGGVTACAAALAVVASAGVCCAVQAAGTAVNSAPIRARVRSLGFIDTRPRKGNLCGAGASSAGPVPRAAARSRLAARATPAAGAARTDRT